MTLIAQTIVAEAEAKAGRKDGEKHLYCDSWRSSRR